MTIIAAAALLVSALPAAAASLAPAARITAVSGEATVKYKGTDDFVSVWRHEKAGPGDTVATGPGGGIELLFPDGSLVVLGESTEIVVEAVAPARTTDEATGERRITAVLSLTLVSGGARFAVGPGSTLALSAGGDPSAFRVVTSAVGADVTVALYIFQWGEYVGVRGGCAFFSGPPLESFPICAGGSLRLGSGGPTMMGLDESVDSLLGLSFSQIPPVPYVREAPVTEITLGGTKTVSAADGVFHLHRDTGTRPGGSALIEGMVDGEHVVLVSIDDGARLTTVVPDADGRWRYRAGDIPADGYTLTAKTMYVGTPPPGISAPAGRTAPPPGEKAPAVTREGIDADTVASRFVGALAGALNRGDTAALSALVAPDYTGLVGGTSRAALLRGVSDFFRGGGTLSVSMSAGPAAVSERNMIVRASFSATVNGAPKSGAITFWLTDRGRLVHAEGDWLF